MKNWLLAICLIAAVSSTHAQVIFREDFDGIAGPTAGGAGTYTFPTGWLLRNVDNRTPNAQVAYINEAWERREDFGQNVGDSCAFSTSYYSPAGPADDWMWTPLINIPANAVLKWRGKAYDPLYPDGYEVRIMKSADGTPTGGTGSLGNQVSASTQVFSVANEASAWTNHTVNLAAFAGQSIYIGFRNNSNDQFILCIDDVSVEVTLNYDAQLVSSLVPNPYSQTPLSQGTPIALGGRLRNNGTMSMTNVVLNAVVYDASNTPVYTGGASPITLTSGATADVTIPNTFAATTTGDYRIDYSISSTETDDQPANNTGSRHFYVSDSTFAVDTAAITGNLGIGAGVKGYLGVKYGISHADELSSVSIFLNVVPSVQKISAAVFSYSGGKPGAVLYEAPEITMTGGTPGWFTIPTDQLTLNAGDTIVVAAVEIDSTLAIGQTTDIFNNKTMWVNWATIPGGDWMPVESFGASFSKAFMIRANFGESCDPANIPDLTITGGTQTVCADANTAAVQFSSTNASATFNWTNNTPSIGLNASGSGDIASFAATNTGTAPVTATISVSAKNGFCSSPPQTFTITVNPKATVVATPAIQTTCGAITTIALSSPVTGATFTWTRNHTSDVTGMPASGTGDISGGLVNTTSTDQVVEFIITPSFGGCPGDADTATVTVHPTPTVNTVNNREVCNGNQVSGVHFTGPVTGTTFAWTNDTPSIGLAASGTGDIAAFNGLNTGTEPVTATISVVPTAGTVTPGIVPELLYYRFNGTGTSVPNEASASPSGAESATFQGSSTQGTGSICDGALIGSGNSSSTDYLNTNWNTNLSGSWSIVFKTSNIGPSPTLFYPFGDLNAGQFRCFTNGVAGASNWILRGDGMNDVVVTGAATIATHSVAFVYDAPANNIYAYLDGVLVNTVAQSAGLAFASSSSFKVGGYSSNVGLPANGQLDEFGLFNRAITATEVATLAGGCNVVSSACTGPATTFTIKVNPTATATATPASQSICNGANIATITPASSSTGATFNWTRDHQLDATGIAASGTGAISGQLTNTTTAPITVTFTITPLVNDCPGTPTTATVTVQPTATVDNVSNQSVCNGASTAAIHFTSPTAGATFSWTNDTPAIGLAASGTGDIAAFNPAVTGNAPVIATITVTPIINSCPGTPTTFTITVKPLPVMTVSPSSQTVCSGSAISAITFGSNVSGSSFTWVRTNAANTPGITTSGNGNVIGTMSNATLTAQTTTFTITPSANGCPGADATASVTVLPVPSVDAVSSQVVCNNSGTGAIHFTSPQTGTITYSWTNDNPSIGLAASGTGDIASFTALNSGTTQQTATIIVTPHIAGAATDCPGTTTSFTIKVNPTITLSSVSSQVVCNNTATTATSFSSNAGDGTVTYSWTNDTPSIGLAASGTGNIGVFNAINSSAVPVTATITVTPVYSNGAQVCSGNSGTFTIKVNPTPAASVTPASQAICTGTAITAIVPTSGVSGTTFTWTRDNTGNVSGIVSAGTGTISGSLTNNTAVPQTVTFTITPSANGCPGTPVTATVTVNPLPTIVCPGNINVNAAAGTCSAVVTYPVATVTGTPAPVVTYSIPSGSTFPVGTTTVTVTATNTCQTVTCSFTITVNDVQLPVITSQPAATATCLGGNASFSIVASNVVSYQWQVLNGATWTNINGANSATYAITNATSAMNGNNYRVQLTGGCTGVSYSNAAVLTVNQPPVVQLNSQHSPLLLPGETVTIEATATPAGGTYVWRKDNTIIPGASGSSLPGLGIDDQGVYTLTYTDPNGCVNTSVGYTVGADASEFVYVYPNPNSGTFVARVYNRTGEVLTVRLHDGRGTALYESKITTGAPYTQLNIDLKGRAAAGTYILSVYNSAKQLMGSKKVIIVH